MEATEALQLPLRARFAKKWPESPQSAVNVLCEGPGVLEASPVDLLPGPVVAVNRAVALSWLFPIDLWASTDDPRNLWEWGRPYLRREVKILTIENNIPIWHKLLGLQAFNRRVYAPSGVFMEASPETGGEGYIGMDGKPPLVPTVLHVIGWLSRIGAKHVRLFGCDMRGDGSPIGPFPFQEEPSTSSRFRWEVERAMIAIAMKTYRTQGKRLERWSPERKS